jgi:D-alanyl-D-alanine carboxypeptidase
LGPWKRPLCDIVDGLTDTYFFRDNLKALVNYLIVYPENWYAVGAMYSTVNDPLAFSNVLFGAKLLKRETLALMVKPVLDDYGYGLWSYDTQDQWQGAPGGQKTGAGHGGSSQLYRFLDDDATIIILSNTGTTTLDEFVAKIGRKVRWLIHRC